MHMRLLLVAAFCLAWFAMSVQAEVFRCETEDGQVEFRDSPCEAQAATTPASRDDDMEMADTLSEASPVEGILAAFFGQDAVDDEQLSDVKERLHTAETPYEVLVILDDAPVEAEERYITFEDYQRLDESGAAVQEIEFAPPGETTGLTLDRVDIAALDVSSALTERLPRYADIDLSVNLAAALASGLAAEDSAEEIIDELDFRDRHIDARFVVDTDSDGVFTLDPVQLSIDEFATLTFQAEGVAEDPERPDDTELEWVRLRIDDRGMTEKLLAGAAQQQGMSVSEVRAMVAGFLVMARGFVMEDLDSEPLLDLLDGAQKMIESPAEEKGSLEIFAQAPEGGVSIEDVGDEGDAAATALDAIGFETSVEFSPEIANSE